MNINMISLSHPVVKQVKEYKKKASNYVVIEDLSILSFIYEDKKKLNILLYCPELINKESTIKLLDGLKHISSNIYEVSSKTYFNIVEKENSAGIIGVYRDEVKTLNDLDAEKQKFIVVLDHLETPGNIGTIIRTCDGANVDAVILVDEIVKSTSFKVVQASRGMSLFIEKYSCTYEELQEYLLSNNYDIYLGEPEKGKPYNEYDYNNKIALIVGNERFGINEKWYKNKHLEVFIPMKGKMPCLNVSSAASILIYEAFIKRNSI